MKRFFVVAIAAGALLIPTLAAAQGGTLVYRPEVRSYVWVPAPQPAAASARTKSAPPPADVIARHERMAAGLRSNPRSSIAQAAVHCDRLITEARRALRASF